MRIIYGNAVEVLHEDIFVVQAIWPDKDKKEPRWFNAYNASAFDDKDHPSAYDRAIGTFDKKNKAVANHKSRVYQATGGAPKFTDPAAALAYAAKLKERGQLTAAQGSEPWRKSYLGKIFTRVVRETLTKSVVVVDGVDT